MTRPCADRARVATGGLLAVHAHPDDETLSNGALLATWAAAGRPVTVVTCTRGERGEVIPPGLRHLEGDHAALAAHREQELAAALAALGVADHVFLDRVASPRDGAGGVPVAQDRRFVDSGMAWAGAGRATAADDVPADAFVRVALDEAAGRLAAVLRRRRPAVVVGYEPGGGYGHPDHVRAHQVMHRAVELAASADGPRARWRMPVVLWTVVEELPWRSALGELSAAVEPVTSAQRGQTGAGDPAAAHGAGHRHLAVARPDSPPSVVRRGPVDVCVPVPPVLDRVLAALDAHRTQVQAVARTPADGAAVARFALSNDVLQPVLREETYVVAAGHAGDVDWPAAVTVVRSG